LWVVIITCSVKLCYRTIKCVYDVTIFSAKSSFFFHSQMSRMNVALQLSWKGTLKT
jgi:hypothetical protein